MSKKDYIRDNFDPKYESKGINEKRILVTTDSLSEGINLHRASIIFNYDLPWNPTRVMQRVGRINRVGSRNEQLYVYNFFPRANTREHLTLEESIKSKVQMFNELLGEDSKTITDDEHVTSYNLYDFLMMANKLDDETDLMSNGLQMSYIRLLNNLIETKPEYAKKIQNLPDKIRVARYTSNESSIVTFIKQGWIKKFMKYENGSSKEIEFEEAAQLLKSDENEKSVEIPKNYFEGFNANREFYNSILNDSKVTSLVSTASPNEKVVRQNLRGLLAGSFLNTNDREYLEKVDKAIKRGSLTSKVFKDIKNALTKNNKTIDSIIKCFKDNIDDVYLIERSNYDINNSLDKPKIIVLSEYLTKEGA